MCPVQAATCNWFCASASSDAIRLPVHAKSSPSALVPSAKSRPEKRPDCVRLSRLSVSQPVERLVRGWQIALELPFLPRSSFVASWTCLSLLLGPLHILGSTILRFVEEERMDRS